MKVSKQYYVYIMASKSSALYVGVTNNLQRRIEQHKQKLVEGFTHKYNVTRLVHYEIANDVHAALAREKQIKSWRRSKKIELIESSQPGVERLERRVVMTFWLMSSDPTVSSAVIPRSEATRNLYHGLATSLTRTEIPRA